MKFILFIFILFPFISNAETDILITKHPSNITVYQKTIKKIKNDRKRIKINTQIEGLKCEYEFRNLDYDSKNNLRFIIECYEIIKVPGLKLSELGENKKFNQDAYTIAKKYQSGFRHFFDCKPNKKNNGCNEKQKHSYTINNKGHYLIVSFTSK